MTMQKTKEGGTIKKDALRDYATSAYIFWARHGCPTYEEAAERIRKRALGKACGIDPQKAKQYAEAEVEKARAGLEDIRACEAAFRKLDESGRGLVCEAVRAVYMSRPRKHLSRGEISGRVVRFSMERFYSERQVYRFLHEACILFAESRGLRMSDDELG